MKQLAVCLDEHLYIRSSRWCLLDSCHEDHLSKTPCMDLPLKDDTPWKSIITIYI